MTRQHRSITSGAMVLAAVVLSMLFPTTAPAAPSTVPVSGPEQRIIVKYSGGQTAVPVPDRFQTLAARYRKTLSRIRTTGTGADVLTAAGPRIGDGDLADLARQISAEPPVEYAEVDGLLKPTLVPNDSHWQSQWHYYEATGGINLPNAWNTSTGTGVVVGVVDTGYRPHTDLAANIVGGYDFVSSDIDGTYFTANDGNGRDSDAKDPGDWNTSVQCAVSTSSWHGTHVAGTVAAVTNNGAGVAGVAFGAKVLPLRALGRCGGYFSDIADAMVWGSGGSVSGVPINPNPAKVLNLSLGGSGSCPLTLQNAINSARGRGAVVVVAAGNGNTNASTQNPANCIGVVTVAATDRNGAKASYSNYGAVVDIAAPGGGTGGGVLSTYNTGTSTPGSDSYAYLEGTSMAAPHVAGVAALLLSKSPGLTPDQVESTLKNTARAFPGTCSQCGTGIVNAAAVLAGGTTTPTTTPTTTTPPPSSPTTTTTTPPPSGTALTNGIPITGLAGAQGSEKRFTMAVPSGRKNLTFNISGGTGDADLYVRFGSAPTTSSFSCRPYRVGNSETCTFATAQTGTYHVMIRGYRAYSGVTLKGSYT